MSLRAFEGISAVTCLIWFAATVVGLTLLYKRPQKVLTAKKGIPLPPGPPARWFWENALPSVK